MSCRVISLSSGKGGVGKTSLTANLGVLWAKQGKRVLVIDGDWSLGKLGILLDARPQWTVEEVLNGRTSLANAVTAVSGNLDLLASPSGVLGLEELSEVARTQLLYEMESLAERYDLILFDHSSGIHGGVLSFAAASHQHVIITTAEPTSYTDAYAIMKILSKRFGIREFECVVTMSQHKPETERIMERFMEVARSHLGVRLRLHEIFPWEARMAESIRRRRPFVDLYPDSSMTAQLKRLARGLEERECQLHHGLQFFYPERLIQTGAR